MLPRLGFVLIAKSARAVVGPILGCVFVVGGEVAVAIGALVCCGAGISARSR